MDVVLNAVVVTRDNTSVLSVKGHMIHAVMIACHVLMAPQRLLIVLETKPLPFQLAPHLHLAVALLPPTAKQRVVGLLLTSNVPSVNQDIILTLNNDALHVVAAIAIPTFRGLVRGTLTPFALLVIVMLVVLAKLDTLLIFTENVFLTCVCSMDAVLPTSMSFARNMMQPPTSVCAQ